MCLEDDSNIDIQNTSLHKNKTIILSNIDVILFHHLVRESSAHIHKRDNSLQIINYGTYESFKVYASYTMLDISIAYQCHVLVISIVREILYLC